MSKSSPQPSRYGQARLFPLPNLVFFPHVMQPLHIFEPRYRQMTADALMDDRLIAMVLPRPGWESDYVGTPAIHRVACVGRILTEQCLEDGRFNILLRGQVRIRIIEEMPTPKLYRIARTEILQEAPITDADRESCWRRTLIGKAPAWFPNQTEVVEQLCQLLHSDLALGTLCDIITFALPIEAELKQTLLEELNVEARLQCLHDCLDAKMTSAETAPRMFPPEFSVN